MRVSGARFIFPPYVWNGITLGGSRRSFDPCCDMLFPDLGCIRVSGTQYTRLYVDVRQRRP